MAEDDEAGSGATTADRSDRPPPENATTPDAPPSEERLKEVEEQIEEGRRALADVAKDTDPEPDEPPIAEGEGAANAPPG